MFKNLLILLFAVSLSVTIGCTSNESKDTAKVDPKERIANIEKEINSMISEADIARKKAKSVGGEWRDTGKFIKGAKKALASGKYEKAIKLAKKADREAHIGYQQAMNQKDKYMPSYFKF